MLRAPLLLFFLCTPVVAQDVASNGILELRLSPPSANAIIADDFCDDCDCCMPGDSAEAQDIGSLIKSLGSNSSISATGGLPVALFSHDPLALKQRLLDGIPGSSDQAVLGRELTSESFWSTKDFCSACGCCSIEEHDGQKLLFAPAEAAASVLRSKGMTVVPLQ